MDNLRLPRRARIAVIGVALALMMALPIAANADTTGGGGPGGAHLTINPTVRVISKVVAVVHLSFTCDELQAFDFGTGEIVPTTAGVLQQADAQVWQASGRSVAGGGSFICAFQPVTCDGTTVNTLDIAVPTTTVPYKAGSAAASADVFISDLNMTTGASGSAGPVSVKLVTK